MGDHARLSPSHAPTWMNCAASVEAEKPYPDVPSEFAAEGTVAHKVRELCLKYDLDAYNFIGQKKSADGFTFEVTPDMAEFIQPGVDRLRELGGTQFYEKRLNLSRWMEDQFGTLDAGVWLPKQNLVVIDDFKYGQGVAVSPVENEQLKIYALGFWDNFVEALWKKLGKKKMPDFLLNIDQPRHHAGGGEWKISGKDLLEFGEFVRAAARRTYRENAKFNPGPKQCQWCKHGAANNCDALHEYNLAHFGLKFRDLDKDAAFSLPDIETQITPERRAVLLKNSSQLQAWLTRLHADAINDALAGRATPGQKAVMGRKGPRQWEDEIEAEEVLGELGIARSKLFKRTLVSPAQAEKLISAEDRIRLRPYVTQSDGKPILVDENDERPALETHADRFQDFSD